mmetsp:Transcript_53410/g.124350  ORF Transcript_53410/g.124350 Transcript_53410/m.124350 type:complete len:756 (-) Transcript_53410:196-2463(-)
MHAILLVLALLTDEVFSQERLDFAGAVSNRVLSDEQVVEGTISLNGTITQDSVSQLNWAAQNALVETCGHGTKVDSTATLELSQQTHRALDIKFWVLPRIGGGGDCAMTLVEAAAGGYLPPFPATGASRKPTFRNMLQNQLALITNSAIMSDMFVRLWRITCAVQPVVRTGNTLTQINSQMACSNYASGWEVYYSASLTEPATAEGGSWVPSYSTGNTDSLVDQLADRCMVANSACYCASLGGCGWREQGDGSKRCATIASGDTRDPVACSDCQTQPECPPLCSSATFACTCAALPTSCVWQNGECKASAGAGNVPCSACVVQDKCQALRPQAIEFGPNSLFALPRSGTLSIIEIVFNVPLGPLKAARGVVRFFCGTEGREPTRTSVKLLEYTVPGAALSVEGNTLKLQSGMVFVAEATFCTLVAEDGVVTNVDGLPSKPVDFGAFIFQMKDSVSPVVQSFLPSAGSGSVNPGTKTVSITFSERIMATPDFSAFLTLVSLLGDQLEPPVPLSLDSVNERILRISVEGLLQPGRSYEITMPAGSVTDYGNQLFQGLASGVYKFKTSGNYDDVVVVDALTTGPSVLFLAGAIGAGVVVLLAVSVVAFRVYVVSREPPDVPPELEGEAGPQAKSPPKIRFDEEAMRAMQIEELPATPDNRKSYNFDDELGEYEDTGRSSELRKIAHQEQVAQRHNAIVGKMQLPRPPGEPSHQRGSFLKRGRSSNRVHPPAEKDADKTPKKEPPKMKMGHYLVPAWKG